MDRSPKSKAKERVQKALDAIPDLKQLRHGSPEFEKWHRNTEVAIANTFGQQSRHVKDFTHIQYSLMVWGSSTPGSSFQRAYVRGLDSASSVLQSMVDEIGEYWEEDGAKPVPAQTQEYAPNITDRRVFIIHGRDESVKETVARFITTLRLTPVILHEQSNQGRTIIEKFEKHAEVGFAVALLTPDDVGALQGHEGNLTPRARQNVIFEFGYFMGQLGRRRVCALIKESVEVPSDYAGVVYISFDISGVWKTALVKELKAAGINVDANLAL